MSNFSVIVVAAGKSERLKSKISKPLIKINSKPVLTYSLEVFDKLPQVKEIIVVANDSNIGKIRQQIKSYKIKKVGKVVLGGKRRQDSVFNGLLAVNPKTDFVLVHDGGRPFIDKKLVLRVINQASKTGAAIPGIPVKATVKQVTRSQGRKVTGNFIVKKTINRSDLWEVQTPQGFRKDLLFIAYSKFSNINLTDDASALEKMGIPVSVVEGSSKNIKITTPEDLIIAQTMAKRGK